MNNSIRLHWCCGDVYLKGYTNIDIEGIHAVDLMASGEDNINETTLDNYFKYPFEYDLSKRVKRPFIIDAKMNILKPWLFSNNSVDEIVMISCFEHFDYMNGEVAHIINESQRVLKPGGIWKFDFPNIKEVIEQYYDTDPFLCMELIYCNHKNKYSIHHWGYNEQLIEETLGDGWILTFTEVVKHDYPMMGVIAEKLKDD